MKPLRKVILLSIILTFCLAHGMLSPIEAERLRQLDELEAKYSESTLQGYGNSNEETEQDFVDECEILDWDLDQDGQNYSRASSHKLVEMADDQITPLRIRDGNFSKLDCAYHYYEKYATNSLVFSTLESSIY